MNRRQFLKFIAAPFVVAGGLFGASRAKAARGAYYAGPVSDHFDGIRFFNPGFPTDKSRADLFRFMALEGKARWPAAWPSPFRDVPPATSRRLRVTLIGHASYLIQVAGLNILLDPVYSERCSPVSFAGPKRVNPPGIAFDDLPKIHIVIVTHNHYDHLDTDTLSRLVARDAPRIVTPLGNDTIMRNHDAALQAEAYDWGDRVELGPGVAATLVPTAHWSARYLADRRKALWASFIFDTPDGRIYHVGDSGFANGMNFRAHRALGPFRLALLPIGAYEPRWFMETNHMNPQDAVEAFQLLGVKQAIGHHWGTFQLTAEEVEAPERDLATALQAANIRPELFVAFRPGQVFSA